MKINTSQSPPQFSPIKLELTFESEAEFIAFAALASCDAVMDAFTAVGLGRLPKEVYYHLQDNCLTQSYSQLVDTRKTMKMAMLAQLVRDKTIQ